MSVAATDQMLLPAFVVLSFWLASKLCQHPRRILRLPILPFSLLIASLLISVALSVDTSVTLPQIARAGFGLLAVAVLLISPNDSELNATYVMLLTCGLVCISALLAMAAPWIVEWDAQKLSDLIPRYVYSLFQRQVDDGANPNVLAGAVAPYIPLLVALGAFVYRRTNIRLLILATVVVAAMCASVVLTQSRGAWIALVGSLVALCACRWRKLTLIAVGVLLFGSVFLPVLPMLGFNVCLQEAETTSGIGACELRQSVWLRGVQVFLDFPVTGVGMGLFREVNQRLYAPLPRQPDVPHVHNLSLQIAIDLGVFGVIGWLGAVVSSLRSAFHALNSVDEVPRFIALGVIAGWIVVIIHGTVDSAIWGMMRTSAIVFIFWGLSLILRVASDSHPPGSQNIMRSCADDKSTP